MTLPIKDQKLKTRAFTHRSYLNESPDVDSSNERLEFLGDAVLELIVSKHLFHKFPDKPEGELTALRASLVKTTTLAQIASKLDFGSQLLMSKGEDAGGGRQNPGLLANTFEAVLGAIYLDSDLETATAFLQTHLFPLLDTIIRDQLYRDFKSLFQETVQAQGHPTPTYEVVDQSGPDHQKSFTVSVLVADKPIATGSGMSKQQAQQQAAQNALKKLEEGKLF